MRWGSFVHTEGRGARSIWLAPLLESFLASKSRSQSRLHLTGAHLSQTLFLFMGDVLQAVERSLEALSARVSQCVFPGVHFSFHSILWSCATTEDS